jgi:hypothetical protein
MSYRVQANDAQLPNSAANLKPSILLQRLLNPYVPYNPNFAAATPWTYNPYVTVDYVDPILVQDGRLFSTSGNLAPVETNLVAYGRRQPYSAVANQWAPQAPVPPNLSGPQNTFFRNNGTTLTAPNGADPTLFYTYPPVGPNQSVSTAFDVPYHPDRQPMSVADLLHVSGYKPHEFTQQFVDSNGYKFAHRAPWSDQRSRILRLLDFLTLSSRMNGFTSGGRAPGKININTVWGLIPDPLSKSGNTYNPLFRALCDAQTANQFTQDDVDAIWRNLLTSRSPDTDPATGNNMPGSNSKPFWSLGLGPVAANAQELVTPNARRGIGNTFYRLTPGATSPTGAQTPPQQDLLQGGATAVNGIRLLEPNKTTPPTLQVPSPGPPVAGNATPPIKRLELLSKILGNVTTRSNVFGVWLTVGFFRVTNDQTVPVQLAEEYVWPSSQGVIRHKFFALVDRTQLQVWPTVVPPNGNSITLSSGTTVSYPVGQPMVTLGAAITLPVNAGVTASYTTASVSLMDANKNGITPLAVNPPQKPNGVVNPNTLQTWYLPPLSPIAGQPTPLGSSSQYYAILTFEPDTNNEETVVVTSDGNGGYQGVFYKSHAAGVTVISRGNPGPWTAQQYDPAKDPAVIPYTAKIN